MANGHAGLPKSDARTISKALLLERLSNVDNDESARKRILAMETDFRRRINTHIAGLPAKDAIFRKFKTNPFVLMIQTLNKGYLHVSQIESDILPAKLFSSMETSAGKMVELVVLPVYGWQVVPSVMHSADSVLDGKKLDGNVLRLATLKSGPECLNDEMSKDIAEDILRNFEHWATEANVKEIEFTYGVLYGTPKQSNKKDWHILRNLEEKIKDGVLTTPPKARWDCAFDKNGITVRVTIRIGTELWRHFGQPSAASTAVAPSDAFTEVAVALIRACVAPTAAQPPEHEYTICDLPDIVSLGPVQNDFNVSLLQRSQLEWLFFFARHFCDQLTD
jgi:type II restriction endonuclease EcoO109I-like protein